MSARDELAYVIVQHPWLDPELFGVANWPKGYCPTCGKIIEAGHNSPAHAEHIADQILAAGYRKPRTISTAAERAELRPGTIAVDEGGNAWKRGTGSWVGTGEGGPLYDEDDLTLTILHEPEVQ